MNETVNQPSATCPAEKLALAQAAFREFYTRCFWFMRRDAEIVAEEIPYVCERLRADGGRRVFLLPQNYAARGLREKYPSSAGGQPES